MSQRLRAAVVAISLAACQVALAAAPIVSSSFELSGLRYSLSSLDLTGQSKPSFSFGFAPGTTGQLGFAAGAFVLGMSDEANGLLALAPGLFPGVQASQTTPGGLATYSNTTDTIRGGLALTSDQLTQAMAAHPEGEGVRVGSGIGSAIDQPWRIVLAPRTSLTWSGYITQHLTVDQQALRAQLAPMHQAGADVNVMLFSSVSIGVESLDAGLRAANPDPGVGSYLDASFGYDPSRVLSAAELPPDQTIELRPFSFTLVNPSNVAAGGTYFLSAVSGFGVGLTPVPVPEAGTWLLMALGLAGLATVTRRRHGMG